MNEDKKEQNTPQNLSSKKQNAPDEFPNETLKKTEPNKKRKNKPEYKKKRVFVPTIAAIVMFSVGIFAAIHSQYYQSTDDAYIEGHIVTISPTVSGPVKNVYIDDNKEVQSGDLLIEIDPDIYITKVNEAQGKLLEARASLNFSEKNIEQSGSSIEELTHELSSLKSKLDFVQKDYKRYSQMYKEGIVSKQEYDSSLNALTVAQANLKAGTEKINSAQIALKSALAKKESALADIKKIEAEVEHAKLNLSYTKITAPQSGSVTSKNVEKGNYVQAGQALFAIVPKKMWLVANFKETQLTNMKIGQPVSIKIDTYPGKKFYGSVDSIQRATGAKASLFPPENAVGSYVKIVQRIPVKIVFDEAYAEYNIVPGMSVVPKVKVK